MFTVSTPAAWSRRAASIVRSMRTDRGGSISTEMKYRPSASAEARRVGGGASSVVAAIAVRTVVLGGTVAAGGRADIGHPRVDRRPHRRDVVGRRAAAAAHDRRPGVEHVADHPAEVVGRRRVHELPLDALRQAGVGEDGLARAVHRDERVEAADRTGPAVHAEHVDVDSDRERARGHRGVGAVREHDVLAEREQRHDRQVGRRGSRLLDGDREVVDERERLEPEGVDAALEQALDGLPERRPHVGIAEVQDLAVRRAQRPDRSGDQHVATGDVARLAGDLRTASGQLAGAVGEAVRGKPHAVGTEGGGLDDVGADRQVLAVDRTDQLGAARDQLVEDRSLRDAAAEQQRAHRPVGQQRTGRQSVTEPGPGVAGRHASSAGSGRASARPRRRARPCGARSPRAGRARSARSRSSGSSGCHR